MAFALDCCDREVMSWVATTKGIDAALVGDLMMKGQVQVKDSYNIGNIVFIR
jgi:hypothetical protein